MLSLIPGRWLWERAVPGTGPGPGDIGGECPMLLHSDCSESESGNKFYTLRDGIQ